MYSLNFKWKVSTAPLEDQNLNRFWLSQSQSSGIGQLSECEISSNTWAPSPKHWNCMAGFSAQYIMSGWWAHLTQYSSMLNTLTVSYPLKALCPTSYSHSSGAFPTLVLFHGPKMYYFRQRGIKFLNNIDTRNKFLEKIDTPNIFFSFHVTLSFHRLWLIKRSRQRTLQAPRDSLIFLWCLITLFEVSSLLSYAWPL